MRPLYLVCVSNRRRPTSHKATQQGAWDKRVKRSSAWCWWRLRSILSVRVAALEWYQQGMSGVRTLPPLPYCVLRDSCQMLRKAARPPTIDEAGRDGEARNDVVAPHSHISPCLPCLPQLGLEVKLLAGNRWNWSLGREDVPSLANQILRLPPRSGRRCAGFLTFSAKKVGFPGLSLSFVTLFFARTLSSFPLSDAKETDSIADSILSSMFALLGAELETCPVNLLPFKCFVKFLCSRPISDTPVKEYQPSKLNHPETSLVKANPRVPESM
jgi:hypothetical protein